MTRALTFLSLFVLTGCGISKINPLVFDDLAKRPPMRVERINHVPR